MGEKEFKKSMFFKFKIDKRRDDSVLLQIADVETRYRYDLSTLEGWQQEGRERIIKEEEHYCCPELVRFPSLPGEYLCKFDLSTPQLPTKKSNSEPIRGIIKRRDAEEESSECRKKVKIHLGP